MTNQLLQTVRASLLCGAALAAGGLSAAGFHTVRETEPGRWRAIDPEGRAYTVFGVDHVTSRWPRPAALVKKFGSREAWRDDTCAKLRAWGFNLLGDGTDELMRGQGFATTANLSLGRRFASKGPEYALVPNRGTPGSGFPNVFHPDFPKFCAERVAQNSHRGEREFFGYFLDNELDWLAGGRRDAGIYDACLRLPATHTAHGELVRFLAARNLKPSADVPAAVKLDFLRHAAEAYFRVQCEAIRACDPDHMVLGCRFAGLKGAHEAVWEVAGRFCDVVSFNCYPWCDLDRGALYTDRSCRVPLTDELRRFGRLTKRPMLVTEWSFPALDSGLPCLYGCGIRFQTQAQRATATRLFVETFLSLPFMIGYDYFMWRDEPPEGLSDNFPEDTNYGLVSIWDEPYAELVKTFAELHRRDWTKPCKAPVPRPAPKPFVVPRDELLAAAFPANCRKEPDDPVLDVAVGSSNIVESITLGGEPFGALEADVRLYSPAKNLHFKARTGKVLRVAKKGERTEVTVAFGTAGGDDGGEALFALTRYPGRSAFLAELVSVRNTANEPYDVIQVALDQHSPFRALNLEEAAQTMWKRPQRAAFFAEDGRWMGAVSTCASYYDAAYEMKLAGHAYLVPTGGVRTEPGRTAAVPDAWFLYLLGKDGRPGWRERTDRLPIFPAGNPAANRAAARKVRTEIDGRRTLTGSSPLALSRFRPVTDPAVRARLEPTVAGLIRVADLSAEEAAAFGARTTREVSSWRGGVTFPYPMLVADGRQLTLSRWPNEGWAQVARFGNPGRETMGSFLEELHPTGRSGMNPDRPDFFYFDERPSRWTRADEVLIYGMMCYDWYDSVLPVVKIDTAAKRIETCHAHCGISAGDSSPRRWRAINLIEEIDSFGEYAIDRAARRLYLLPPPEVEQGRRPLRLACATNVLFAAKGLRDVEFRGLVFEENVGGGIRLEDCENVVFRDCAFRNLGHWAAFCVRCRACSFVNCTFENVTGGVCLSGGDRATLRRGENLVEGCTFRNYTERWETGLTGLALYGVGHTARGNLFADCHQGAVQVNGNEMAVEYNVFTNVVNAADDCGAFYLGRNATACGNVLRHNLFVDCGRPPWEPNRKKCHGTTGVYFDDGAGGNLAYGDTFVRCGFMGLGGFGAVFSHGGHDNWVRNCTFVSCERALGSSPWNDTTWSAFVRSPEQCRHFTNEVAALKRPYTLVYPRLAHWFDPAPEATRRNHARDCRLDGCLAYREASRPYEHRPGFVCGNWDVENFEVKDSVPPEILMLHPNGKGRIAVRRPDGTPIVDLVEVTAANIDRVAPRDMRVVCVPTDPDAALKKVPQLFDWVQAGRIDFVVLTDGPDRTNLALPFTEWRRRMDAVCPTVFVVPGIGRELGARPGDCAAFADAMIRLGAPGFFSYEPLPNEADLPCAAARHEGMSFAADAVKR